MIKKVSENPLKNREKDFTPLVIIAGLLITMYLTANIMAVKLVTVFDLTLFDAGTITFPFAYMLGDVLTEIWGYKTSKKVIWLTFFCNIILVLATSVGLTLPYPDYTKETADAYAVIFTYIPRIVIASLIAFVCGELSNAWILEKIKGITNGRFLWMRTIGSSIVGYVFDTVLFVLIAFAGTASTKDLITMIFVQYITKVLIEMLGGTPLAYALIAFLKKRYPEE